MGSEDALPNSSSGRRHRGSADEDRDMEDGEVEEESKRRRHHHHRHGRHHSHRHHRRSHVKQGKEEGEDVEEEGEELEEDHVVVGVSVMDVDEREEGEIFDNEDGEIVGVCAGSDRDHLADETMEECTALNADETEEESGNCLLHDGELRQGDEFLRAGKSRHGRISHDEAVTFRSRSYPEVSPIKNENQREVQSGSYGSRESELSTKRKREVEVNLKWHKEQRHSKSRDSDRNLCYDRKRSATPDGYRENFKPRERSPSNIKYCDEVKSRARSKSASHRRERSYDLNHRTSHANSSDSCESIRSYSDCERGAVHDKQDRHKIRGLEVDYERDKLHRREREHSINSRDRHDKWEERHGSQDRHREKKRGSIRDREIDRRKEREGVRDRNRDKHRGHAKTREINMENERKRIRTKEVEDRERTGDSNRARNRDSHRDHNREADKHKHRDRVGEHDNRGKSWHSREEEDEDYKEKIEQQLAKQEKEDPEKIIEESKKRRQAILEKYKRQQLQSHSETPADSEEKEENNYVAATNNPTADAAQLVAPKGSTSAHDSSDASATDIKFTIQNSSCQNGEIPEAAAGGLGHGHGTPKSERSADMFCDDIFGESPAGVRIMGKEAHLAVERTAVHDNWDDAEGYYSYRFGEVLDGRYEIIAAHGKGVFSTVVRAKDLKVGKGEPEEVAIKIIRNNNTMYKAGLEELVILKKLAGADPEDKRHCVRFISSFKYRNHLCLVFESLHMNLREVLKKFGRNIGLKLTAVRAYAKQLFIALKHLRNCGVLHCDIKPDNMLVNEAKNVLKLCDFGNAMFAGKNEITPYLVSRFYRSPEIILGLPYDHPMDMWSVGCCLFELYNGKVLFPGPSNNEMLRLHMELKGPFPKKMLRKGAFADQHFDHDLNFHATEEDPVTKKPVKRLLLNFKPKDMGTIFTSFPEEDPKMLGHFKDLLERIFVLDPEKRLTVSQALSHPFITGK